MTTDRLQLQITGDSSSLRGAARGGKAAIDELRKAFVMGDLAMADYGKTLGKVVQLKGGLVGFSLEQDNAGKATDNATAAMRRQDAAALQSARSLNLFGDRLGRAFGPGEGLHGRLSDLEMPLRDVEGGVSRVAQATLAFGNRAETASEKAAQGFLLAADSIAAFASGGVAGIAITAAVTGIALLTQTMGDEEEAAKEAKAAQEEHAKSLEGLAAQAAAANVTIALVNAQTREKEVQARARAVQDEIKQEQNKLAELEDFRRAADERRAKSSDHRFINRQVEAIKRHDKSIAATKARLAELEAEDAKSGKNIKDARAKVELETFRNSEDALTKLIDSLEPKVIASVEKLAKVTSGKGGAIATVGAAAEKAAEAALARLDAEDASAALDRVNRDLEAQESAEEASRARRFAAWSSWAGARASQAEANRQADVESFKRAEAAKMAAANAAAGAITSGLFAMAEAGEFSAEKLLQASIKASGQQLVSRGTVHLMEGLAKGLGGNPAGYAESAQGGAMVAAGLAMGAASGAIGRASAPAPSAGGGTPTDTRRSRAADISGGGEGGTTVINFNGPAYDKRGVASVLASGQRMARHRRVQGA